MTISDFIMILAVILGPIIAVQLTRFLDNKKERRERKLQLFKILMSTRSYTTHWDHVMALNRIDLEFDRNNQKEKNVITAWKAYLNLLNDKTIPNEQWCIRRLDLLVDMLHEMAKVLDYDFDKTHIKTSSYSPMAHGNQEEEERKLRSNLINLLEGKQELKIGVSNLPVVPNSPYP